jgi:hypothetical protein
LSQLIEQIGEAHLWWPPLGIEAHCWCRRNVTASITNDLSERCKVAHLKDATGDAIRMEAFKRLWSFTSADEEHGNASATSDRERCAATRITVKLGEDETGRICGALETFSNRECLLASRRIKDEDALAWLYRFAQVAQLLHQLIVECCPTR